MQLNAVYARFYRSLNFDFVRASDERYRADPWDRTPEGDYPFVRVKLRPDITTIVGANESGKTQVLTAIEAALTGEGYDRSDFCRYSRFFGTHQSLTRPEFGITFDEINEGDLDAVGRAIGKTELADIDRVALFRMNQTPHLRIYLRSNGLWDGPHHVKAPNALKDTGLPVPFRIDATVPLPNSVPIAYLVDQKPVAAIGRNVLQQFFDNFRENSTWFADQGTVAQNAQNISGSFRPLRSATEEELAQYDLAANLLLKIAGLNRPLFAELQAAVRSKDGYANSIVDTINSELAKSLDFPHWWSQDSKFELFVSLYEYDLVFMIRDRTGRTYGFNERSEGLKYFLSYFVQYLAHDSNQDGRQEILLMDEPDRFLSSSGQQDLLRIFADFARPSDPGRTPVQVVYVTHSPFLIDKNEADRIRVLEKGEHDEGTRVVSSVAANHYEPLRSAFGSFVAETTFIGNCNLVVEGPSDQVLLAGMSRVLRATGVSGRNILDLNSVTLVPAGGTRHIPYLVYLARGRDVEKPPVIVLLDADKAGDEARTDLQAGGAYGESLIKPEYVVQLGDVGLDSLQSDNPKGIVGIEDLIPLSVALEAASKYCEEFVPSVNLDQIPLDKAEIFPESTGQNKGLLKLLEQRIAAETGIATFHLDKVAFARAVVDAANRHSKEAGGPGAEFLLANFETLLSVLAERKRAAERSESVERISSRINRTKRDFTRTHAKSARREDVWGLMDEIQAQLDESPESEAVRQELASWPTRFALDGDARGLVEDFDDVVAAVRSIAYKATRQAAALG